MHGLRYRPRYTQSIETTLPEIPGDDYLPRLIEATKQRYGPLGIERVLLDAKREAIVAALRPGTLVYTHYLTGLVEPLKRAIEQAGFSVGLYIGDDKAGLSRFLDGKVDVIVSSMLVGTGVDSL